MSESAGKTFRGLQEAYASMYSNNSDNLTEETIVSEVQEEQEFEINEEVLYESIIQYLIEYGFASNEKKAAAMLPHMSEQWADAFVANYILSECFEAELDSLIKEGKDFSDYTWDELYEAYCNSAAENLNEYTDIMPGGGLTNAILGGIGAAGLWGLNNLRKAFSPSQSAFRGYRDYGQSGTSTYKPPTAVKAQVSGDIEPAKPAKPRVRVTATRPEGSTETQAKPAEQPKTEAPKVTQGQGTPTPQPEPPKKPEGPRWLQGLQQGIKQALEKRSAEKDALKAAREAAKVARASQPNKVTQYIGDKLVQKGIPLVKGTLLTALGAAGAGLVDQGLMGGIVGKVARDVTTGSRQLGPKYDELMGRKKEQKPTPRPPSQRNPYGL